MLSFLRLISKPAAWIAFGLAVFAIHVKTIVPGGAWSCSYFPCQTHCRSEIRTCTCSQIVWNNSLQWYFINSGGLNTCTEQLGMPLSAKAVLCKCSSHLRHPCCDTHSTATASPAKLADPLCPPAHQLSCIKRMSSCECSLRMRIQKANIHGACLAVELCPNSPWQPHHVSSSDQPRQPQQPACPSSQLPSPSVPAVSAFGCVPAPPLPQSSSSPSKSRHAVPAASVW